MLLPLLMKYKGDKEKEGLIPTIEMLIEDLQEDLKT